MLVAAALLMAVPALAQDPTVVDPDHYAVEFETDDFRVLRISYGPGESSVMHEHPGGYVLAITDAHMIMHLADGESVEVDLVAGENGWADATVHAPENLSDTRIEVYLIELTDDEYDEEDYDHDDDDEDDDGYYDDDDDDDDQDEDDD